MFECNKITIGVTMIEKQITKVQLLFCEWWTWTSLYKKP